jgi:hypothetical protein
MVASGGRTNRAVPTHGPQPAGFGRPRERLGPGVFSPSPGSLILDPLSFILPSRGFRVDDH